MPSVATTISQVEMEQFLDVGRDGKPQFSDDYLFQNLFPNGFYRLPVEGTYETVYATRVKDSLTLRIYSTIQNGQSREKGADAIRLTLWYRPSKDVPPKLVGTQKKLLRVESWRDNLSKRFDEWETMVGPSCPVCGCPTAERKNKVTKKKFYGCVDFPACRGVVNST